MWKFLLSCCLLGSLMVAEAAVIEYHHYGNIPSYQVPTTTILHTHPGYTIVAPLTKLAHVTYDSVPISHTPFEHVPLFQRVSHVN